MFRRTASAACLRAGVYEINNTSGCVQTSTTTTVIEHNLREDEQIKTSNNDPARDIRLVDHGIPRHGAGRGIGETSRKTSFTMKSTSPLGKNSNRSLRFRGNSALPSPSPPQQTATAIEMPSSPLAFIEISKLVFLILLLSCSAFLLSCVNRMSSVNHSNPITDSDRSCSYGYKDGSLGAFTDRLQLQEGFDLERFSGDWYDIESFDLDTSNNNDGGYDDDDNVLGNKQLLRSRGTSFGLMRIDTDDSTVSFMSNVHVSGSKTKRMNSEVKPTWMAGHLVTCSSDRVQLMVAQSDVNGSPQADVPMMIVATDYNNYAVIFSQVRGMGNSSHGVVKFLSRYRSMPPLMRGKCWLEWHTRSGIHHRVQ